MKNILLAIIIIASQYSAAATYEKTNADYENTIVNIVRFELVEKINVENTKYNDAYIVFTVKSAGPERRAACVADICLKAMKNNSGKQLVGRRAKVEVDQRMNDKGNDTEDIIMEMKLIK